MAIKTTSTTRDLERESAATATREAIEYLLKSFNIDKLPHFERDAALEDRLDEIVQSYAGMKPTRLHMITGSLMSSVAYCHIKCFETRVFIAVYTMLLSMLDCPEVFESLASHNFHQDLLSGSDHFPQFSASAILSSTLDYLNMCFVENTTDGTLVSASADSLPFIEYRRVYCTGVSAAFAVFIWEKDQLPDEKMFLQAMPDIMSFYREESIGEEGTYITDRAYASGRSHLETLRDIVDDTVAVANRVRKLLGEGSARDAWDVLVTNYIAFHVSTPKYRLREIMDVHYVLEDTV
ncbi:hypothetical protein CERSUDRAFT_105307 [Gelatoporia subvermispora B]|uniref:Terpenoid synthase n=1 Tax=Ceriporiopsis subvermispora (strain B) TaxID=914234 RepID=M2REL3_CERS8|nr:hypothetical protein CERSUDRAFT_105307 [Gelatoporia subvermispora B]